MIGAFILISFKSIFEKCNHCSGCVPILYMYIFIFPLLYLFSTIITETYGINYSLHHKTKNSIHVALATVNNTLIEIFHCDYSQLRIYVYVTIL